MCDVIDPIRQIIIGFYCTWIETFMFLQKTLSSILFFCFFFVFLNIDRQTFILWSWNCGWSRGSSRRKPRVGCKHRASWSVRSRCRNWRRPLGTTGLLFRRRAALLRLPVETGPVTVENWDDSLKYWPNTNTTTSSKQNKQTTYIAGVSSFCAGADGRGRQDEIRSELGP